MAQTEFIESELYGGKVKIRFYPNSHQYKVDDDGSGKFVSRKGVTTYLGIKDKSNALTGWALGLAGNHLIDILNAGNPITQEDIIKAIQLHKEKKEEAADIGTITHAWCENYVRYKMGKSEDKPVLPKDKATLLGVNAFLTFLSDHKVEFIDTEKLIYSRDHQFTGILDDKWIIDGELAVVDLKTSNGLYNSVRAQTAAYAKADEEEANAIGKPFFYDSRWALRLAKETEEEYYIREERKKFISGSVTPIKPYQPFEFMKFEGRSSIIRDFNEGFLNSKGLFQWDKDTDFYLNK